MDFHTWWTTSGISLAVIARHTNLPLVTLLQLDQGHCDTLAVARRLRMKLYERYRDPVILSWTFREDDEGGLPVWWWRCTWEEPNLARVCLLLPAKSLDEARDQYWHWMDRHRMPVAPRVR